MKITKYAAPLAMVLFVVSLNTQATDLVVIESNTPNYAAGTLIGSADAIRLGPGETLQLISESGLPKTIEGPFDGPPGDDTASSAGDTALLGSLSTLLSQSGPEANELGVTRAAVTHETPNAWSIVADGSGTHCFSRTQPAHLWRANAGRKANVRIKNVGTRDRVSLPWAAREKTLAWPTDFPLENGTQYTIQIKGKMKVVKLNMKEVPAELPTDAHRVAWMAENGCTSQALALLKGIHD
jgi:hypothetical protein